MTKRRKPRKQDTCVTYTPQQTQRYKSQMSRYQKGLKIAGEHAVHKIDEETYRIPSVRAKEGYYTITTKEDKATVTGTWQGEKPSDGEIELKWQGEKPSDGIINLRWEGKKCIPNPPPRDYPGNFYDRDLSGCSPDWHFLLAIPIKGTGYDENWSIITEPCPVEEVLEAYRTVSGDYSSTEYELLYTNEGPGGYSFFEYGRIYPMFSRLGGFCADGQRPEAYCVPRYAIRNIGINVYRKNGTLNEIIAAAVGEYAAVSKIVEILNFPTSNPGECPLDEVSSSPSAGGSGIGGCKIGTPVTWNCDYAIPREEFSPNWTITSDTGVITNDQNQSLTVTHCSPPESGLSNIKLIAINSVTSNNNGYDVDWECNYPIESEFFSPNWTITDQDGVITNDQNQSLTVTPCPPPEGDLFNIKLIAINSVTSNNNGYDVDWECNYPIEPEFFSPNWTITDQDGVITNDQNQSLTVIPCPPPEDDLSNIKLKEVSTEVEEGEGYKCTCPDFSKKEGAFTPPSYPSMSQERNWEFSDAGAPTWSDGKRRCCHIVAVQQVRKEQIPLPTDM